MLDVARQRPTGGVALSAYTLALLVALTFLCGLNPVTLPAVLRQRKVPLWVQDGGGSEGRANHSSQQPGPPVAGRAEEKAQDSAEGCFLAENKTAKQMCDLRLCLFHHFQAPRLFVNEPTDGAGHRMKAIIEGMAVAVRNQMNFGGIRSNPKDRITEHGSDFRDLVDGFFGCHASWAFYPKRLPSFRADFAQVSQLERSRGGLKSHDAVLLWEPQEWYHNASAPASEYFTAQLRARLRQQLDTRPLAFAPGRPAVALHVRRGDLERSSFRLTPDGYYYALAERVRRLLPRADVHVWSSTQLGMWKGKVQPWWNSSDFDGYRERGMQVHLDDPDLLSVWAHLSRAHVFIMAPSSFSFVPAALNPLCVIFPGWIRKRLDGWMDGSRSNRSSFDSELRACIARAQRPP